MGFRVCRVLLAALAVACAFQSTRAAAAPAAAVVSLTEATFDKETVEHVWLVKFFAPWCQHCKHLAPIYAKLPTDPQIAGSDVRIGEVDCTKQQSICQRFDVQSYPTLKVVVGGRYYEYEGPREVAAMAKFVKGGYKTEMSEEVLSTEEFVAEKKRAQAALEEAEHSTVVVPLTYKSFEEVVLNAGHPWMLKFFAPWCGHCKRLAPTFHEFGKSLQESGSTTKVGEVDCTEQRHICSRFGVQGYPTLLYIRDGKVYRYDNPRTVDALTEYVTTGWKSAEAAPIPEESKMSKIVNDGVEWVTQHTVLSIFIAILAIAIFVAVLVALLDYCLGEDTIGEIKDMRRAKPHAPTKTTKAKDD